MARPPAEEPKVRTPVRVGEPRPVLREGRCPSSDAFPKGGFVTHFRDAFTLFMLRISIAFQEIPWWNPNSCFNLAL